MHKANDQRYLSATNNGRTYVVGFTLTEIAIVLGIIGLILGAIWAAASSVYQNEKATKSVRGVLVAVQAVRSLYANSSTTGSTPGPIASTGLFPADWQTSIDGVAQAGVYGNPYHISPLKSFSYLFGNGTVFGVELDGLTDKGCTTLVSYFNSSASSSLTGGGIVGLVGTAVSITTPDAGTAQLGVAGLPAPDTFAPADACVGGDLNDSVMVAFDMSKM